MPEKNVKLKLCADELTVLKDVHLYYIHYYRVVHLVAGHTLLTLNYTLCLIDYVNKMRSSSRLTTLRQ